MEEKNMGHPYNECLILKSIGRKKHGKGIQGGY